MSQYEFESNQDGDWDDNEEVAWNEADWQNFFAIQTRKYHDLLLPTINHWMSLTVRRCSCNYGVVQRRLVFF